MNDVQMVFQRSAQLECVRAHLVYTHKHSITHCPAACCRMLHSKQAPTPALMLARAVRV